MKRKEFRVLSTLLALCMALALLPGTALAAADGTVNLKPTNEVRWIDRVELPDYALTLYKTLEEAADGDGNNDYLIDNKYYDLDGENIRSNVPGGFMRGTVSNSDGSMTRYTAIVVTTTDIASTDQNTRDYIANCIYTVVSAFKFDHQEVFWINGVRLVSFNRDDGKRYYGLALCADDLTPDGKSASYYEIRREEFRADGQWDVRRAMAQRDADVIKILNTIPDGADRFTQVYYLNDWLSEHNKFNSLISSGEANPWYAYECITALEGLDGEKGPVCSGYSAAFKVLCDVLGIPCVTVRGLGGSGGAHRWNYVQMEDGNWYAVDVNYNSDSGDANRTLHLLVGGKTMIASKEFRERHTEQNGAYYGGVENFLNGPVLNDNAYPRTARLSYNGLPKTLSLGDSVAITPVLIFAADTAYIYSSTALPAGLTLNSDGSITGKLAESADAAVVTVTATNPDEPAERVECTLEFPAVVKPDSTATEGSDSISVLVNGKAVEWTDAKPFLDENNRTMVPLRAVADAMGLEVGWDAEAFEASFTDGGKTIYFPVGIKTARTSDGQTITMNTAAVTIMGRSYAPIRYLAEYFGFTVGWDDAAQTVNLTK